MKAPKPLAAADDTLVLPRAVRRGLERTEEIIKQVYPTEDPNAPPADPPAPEPEPPQPEPPAPAAPAAPAPAPTPEPENFEHMYRSLKGRHDRMQQQLEAANLRIEDMARMMASMAPSTPQPPAPAPRAEKLVTPQEETEYGSEFLTVVGKKAREEVLPEVAQLRTAVQDLTRRVEGVSNVTTMTAREQMFTTFDEKQPDWRDINTSNEFLAWLRLPDPLSGVIRQELLTQAFERNQAARVLAFFNGFLSEEAATAPQGQPTPPAPAQVPGGKVPLETLAAPGRARTTAAPTPAPVEKPVISSAQIAKFYADVVAGKYRGKDAEKNSFEAQIFEAQRDGRIQP